MFKKYKTKYEYGKILSKNTMVLGWYQIHYSNWLRARALFALLTLLSILLWLVGLVSPPTAFVYSTQTFIAPILLYLLVGRYIKFRDENTRIREYEQKHGFDERYREPVNKINIGKWR